MSPFRACICVTLVLTAASCRYFRPIDPNPPRQKLPESEPAAETVTPAVQPDTQPTRPVAQPITQPVEPVPAPVTVTTPVPAPVTPPVTTPVAEPPAMVSPPPVVSRRVGSTRDANIAAMVLASNNTDISYARLVPARAQHADVKKFAERMLTDHNGVNSLIHDLLRKLDLGPEENEMSLDMRDESANKRDILRELSGFAFDSTYMENEVSYHRNFLDAIDGIMLPNVRNSEMRNLLNALRPAVAAHLAHAEQVRATVMMKK